MNLEENMKVLVVGGGGREHALVRKIKESKKVDEIFCTPGNGGISYDAKCFDVAATDIDGVVNLAKEIKADLVVVAPDDPLVAGMVDALNEAGFKTFGPRANAAIIEGSKVFSKELMQKYNIPTAEYKVFDNAEEAIEYIKERNEFPTVIKADGLALGKGVIIPENLDDAIAGVKEIMEDKIFGASGNNIVVEEFLTGPEVSVLAFTDGKCVKPMVSSMDHKRALDGDKGLNTGGMGTVSPNPYYTQDVAKECMDKIFIPTINAMNNEGRTFKGCLYFGLMITPKGPKVIEYNCRFGDPETQVVLPRLKTDIVDIFEAIDNETLSDLDVEWSDDACACVIMASGGYPKSYPKGIEITGLSNGQLDGVTVYHAGTKLQDNKLVTSGGRVLGVTALGDTLENALKKSYDAVEKIHFEGAHYRRDIGKRALEANK
jgi:phosphoribosylamine--glycine ligase